MHIRKEAVIGLLGLSSAHKAMGAPASNQQCAGSASAPVPFYAATLGGFPANVDYFNGSSGGRTAQIAIPAASALNLAFTSDNRRLLVATGDGPGPNDVVVLETSPTDTRFNQVISTVKIDTTINGIAVNKADIVFAHPRRNTVFFAQQNSAGAVALGAFDLCPSSPNQVANVKPITGVDIPGPISTQAAFGKHGRELWWPVPNSAGNGSIVIINTDMRSPGYLGATLLNVGPNFFPYGIAISNGKAYVSGQAGPLRVYDVTSRTLLNTVTNGTGGSPNFVVASDEVGRVYANTVGGNVLRAYEEGTGNFIDETVLGGVGGSNDMKLSPNETLAYIADTNGDLIQVVDLTQQPPKLTTSFGMFAPADLAVQGPVI